MILLLALPAWAFGPDTNVYVGLEPQRVRVEHAEVQAGHLRSAAWRSFAEGEGRGWQARFDEATGTPRHLWGGGVPIDTTSAATVANDLERVLERHAELLGFEPGELALRSASYNERYSTWYVDLDVLRDGAPTYRGGISARVKKGNLVYLRVGTAPQAPVTGGWGLDADAAIALSIEGGHAPDAVHTDASAVRQLLEVQDASGGLRLQRTYMVRTHTADPPGIWVTFVDARTGELLHVHNEVRFATGTVTGVHHERTLDGAPLVTSPMPNVVVETAADSAVADGVGYYSITDGATYTTDLHGDYVDVDNDAGSDAQIQSGSPDVQWTSAFATPAEIDTYVFLHQVRDFALTFAPDVEMATRAFESHVNVNSACNAYYDGYRNSVNFYSAGGGCNNTGQIADVNYHEWGHGFHAWSLEAGFFDGSLSEGAADCMSFFMTGDHFIAPYFGTSGWAIRDVSPDRVYPDDYVANDYYVHDNGLIFGGAIWDLWGLLQADYGAAAGTEVTLGIYAGLLKGGPDVAGSYYEALVADDDNGDLADGTPHQCQIIDAFGRHGLGTLDGGAIGFVPSHEPLTNVPADAPIEVQFDVLETVAECITGEPRSATLWYRINDRATWKDVSAAVTGTSIDAVIPAQDLGTFVEYWLDGTDSEGNDFQAPTSGEFAPYSFFVGDVLEVMCEDFETDDGGFRHALVEGADVDGADDWTWGAPGGVGGDPSTAYSGTNAWGNDLGGGNFNGQYQAGKVNRLRSRKYDTGHYTGVFLQYRRWLNVEDGAFDQAVITANGEEVWTNHDSESQDGEEHHQDRQWVSHSVDLLGAGDQTEVQIGWELHSDEGLEFGGWTLDDVCVYAPATADNRLGIVDFVAEDQGGPIGLSWTNPAHDPVERVLVVRKLGEFPTSWEDGEVVVDVTAPEAGAPVEAVHGNVDGSAGFYAVYASDGEEWLSWTVEGWNAAFVEANEGVPGAESEGGGGVCGCDGTAGGGVGALSLLGLLLVRRRR